MHVIISHVLYLIYLLQGHFIPGQLQGLVANLVAKGRLPVEDLQVDIYIQRESD